MKDEFIPIVNKHDRVLKYLSGKEKIHSQGLRHREVVVYILDTKNQILVQERRDNGTLDHSVAGHVRKGETYLHAALREIEEEVGLKLKPHDLKKIGKFYHRTFSSHKNLYNDRFFGLFLVRRRFSPKDLKPSKREVKSLKFITEKNLRRLMRQKLLAF